MLPLAAFMGTAGYSRTGGQAASDTRAGGGRGRGHYNRRRCGLSGQAPNDLGMTQRGKDFLFVRVVVSERKLSVSEHAMEPTSSQDKHYFLVRRLHSLSGLVPVGVFLCVHLSANATVLVGADEFQRSVDRIHSLGPLLVPVEIVGIFIPLLFHAAAGLSDHLHQQIQCPAVSLRQQCPLHGSADDGRDCIRVHSVSRLADALVRDRRGRGQFAAHDASGAPGSSGDHGRRAQSAWWIAPAYAVGVASCVYHLANGVWTSLITWGITIRPRSQQVAGYFCAAFGFILLLVGLGALRV